MSVLGKFENFSFSKKPSSSKVKEIKIVTIGDTCVGKTSIVDRMSKGIFNLNSSITIGASFTCLNYEHEGHEYKFQFWDTAGQERFRSLAPIYIKKSDIVLVVFDISDYGSFENIKNYWYKKVNETSPSSKVILIGNKMDKVRHVSKGEIENYVDTLMPKKKNSNDNRNEIYNDRNMTYNDEIFKIYEGYDSFNNSHGIHYNNSNRIIYEDNNEEDDRRNKIKYIETSAKSGENIDDLFAIILELSTKSKQDVNSDVDKNNSIFLDDANKESSCINDNCIII